MTTSAWYLRRAVPWPSMLGGLVVGAVLVVAVHRWESAAGAALPVIALLAAAGAAFGYDEPALAVADVTPRGARWAPASRYGAGLVPPAAGLGLLLLAPGEVDASNWALVIAGIGAAGLMLAGVASARQVARPGAAVAGLVVFAGLAPLATGPMLDLPALYPAPDLSQAVTTFWVLLAATALAGSLVGPRLVRR